MTRHFYHNKKYQKGLQGSVKSTQEELLEFNKIVMTCKKCGPLKNSETYLYKSKHRVCRFCKRNRTRAIKNTENHIIKFLSLVEK